MSFDPAVITALAEARDALTHMGTEEPRGLSGLYQGYAAKLARALVKLDNAGVFAALDEQTDYATAEEILAKTALAALDEAAGGPLDPAEWGDTTRLDLAERSGIDRTAVLSRRVDEL